MKSENNVSITLGGGSAYGFANAGFLRALSELNLNVKEVSACSMGALIGGFFAAGYTGKEVYELICSIELKSIAYLLNFNLFKKSVFSERKLRKFLLSKIGTLKVKDAPFDFKVIATDYYNHKVVFTENDLIVDAIIASATLPGFLPVKYGLYDGGYSTIVPVDLLSGRYIKIASNVYYMPVPLSFCFRKKLIKQYIRARYESKKADILVEYNFKTGNMFDYWKYKDYAEIGYKQSRDTLKKFF
ncbi:MAG: patatin-like phospholipase family protein [Candidatus Muiribacteriota bacterium]